MVQDGERGEGGAGPGRVLVVTVHYRTADLLLRCLASLAAERERVPGLEVTVVDNASGDGSVERIRAALAERGWEGWVRLRPSERNGGFAYGNNRGVGESLRSGAPHDLYLLLNPDCEVLPGAVRTLASFLADHPRAGFAGPATEIGRGNLRGTAFRFPGVLSALDEGLHFGPLSRLLARWIVSPPPRAEAHPTDWLSGGCVLVRREVFETVGLMDEGYFLYFEEIDHMRAARRAGWECWYVPAARIVHDAGAATGATGGAELERRMPAYWFASRRRYYLKNHGRLVTSLADLAWAGGNALWNLRRLITREPRREPRSFWRDFVGYNFLGIRPPGR
ncbi:MAG: glycosyltransferase family 2 protein [Planctomycetota bacterium]